MRSGEVIREARLLAGLSQEGLAERIGVPRQSVARWERGAVEPGFDTVRRLLRSCGFDVSLVRYEPDESAEVRLSGRAGADPAGAAARNARRPWQEILMARHRAQPRFDPYAILKRARAANASSYVIVGAFARVLVGADEITRGIDLTPSSTRENLRRLDLALEEINAHRPDGSEPAVQTTDYTREPVIELETDHGEVKIVPFPEGTRGYDDLRRAAERQPIGQGLRPSVASPGDLARMLHGLGREEDMPQTHHDAPPDRTRARTPPRPLDRALTIKGKGPAVRVEHTGRNLELRKPARHRRAAESRVKVAAWPTIEREHARSKGTMLRCVRRKAEVSHPPSVVNRSRLTSNFSDGRRWLGPAWRDHPCQATILTEPTAVRVGYRY